MKQDEIEYFLKLKGLYSDKIENFKLANLNKLMKNKILDFQYNFYGMYIHYNKHIVKYVDSVSEKVDFYIRLNIKYLNDDQKEDNLGLDLTIQQFYSIFNDFQKIETMIKTLI